MVVLGRERRADAAQVQPTARRVWTLAVDTLASYRLAKLLRDDFITQPFRDLLHDRFGPPDRSKISYLFQCPWCMSMYFGVVLGLAHRRSPRVTDVATHALAVSALTGLLAQRAEKD